MNLYLISYSFQPPATKSFLAQIKKLSVHTTLIGVICDTVVVLITLIVGLHGVIYYTIFFTV